MRSGVMFSSVVAGALSLSGVAIAQDALTGCVGELINYGVTPNVAAEACTRQRQIAPRPASPSKPPAATTSPQPITPEPVPMPVADEPVPSADLAFSCQIWEGQPTTMAQTQRGLLPLIVWKSEYFNSSGYTPESRCQIVSSRFQHHAERDNLRFITHGTLNAQKVLCVANRRDLAGGSHNYECQNPLEGSLLLTLESADDPEAILSELFAVASRANWGAVVFRGGSRFGIDLEEVLESREPVATDSNQAE